MTQSDKVLPLIGILDDDQSVSEALGNLLRADGYQTVAFESAEAFLSAGRIQEIRCLVLDVQMPGVDGLELHQRMAARNISIPVIFVTARHGQLGDNPVAQGAVGVLPKPFTGRSLLSAIRLALAQRP
jgi:FixJ family two-component response regulator